MLYGKIAEAMEEKKLYVGLKLPVLLVTNAARWRIGMFPCVKPKKPDEKMSIWVTPLIDLLGVRETRFYHDGKQVDSHTYAFSLQYWITVQSMNNEYISRMANRFPVLQSVPMVRFWGDERADGQRGRVTLNSALGAAIGCPVAVVLCLVDSEGNLSQIQKCGQTSIFVPLTKFEPPIIEEEDARACAASQV